MSGTGRRDSLKRVHALVEETMPQLDKKRRKDILADVTGKVFMLKDHKPKFKPSSRKIAVTIPNKRKVNTAGLLYADFVVMHDMWKEYAEGFLNQSGKGVKRGYVINNFDQLELHGAEVSVKRSSVPTQVGTHGIIIENGLNSLTIIDSKNKVKCTTFISCGMVSDTSLGIIKSQVSLVFNILGFNVDIEGSSL